MSQVVVFGGHGKISLRLARLLTERGDRVDAVVRNPDHDADVSAAGASSVVADLEKSDTAALGELIIGHDAVVFSAGAGGGDPQRTYAVDRDAAIRTMDASATAGVRRFVLVSYFGSSLDHGVAEDDPFHPYAQAKAEADTYLRQTDLDWTIVAPSGLTLDPGTGRIETAEAGALAATVSRDDVATVIAAVLDTPATIGRTITFNQGGVPVDEALSAPSKT